MTVLIVVESPAKSKTISKYLGKDFIVRASYGHILDLVTTGPGNFGVDIDGGFIPKYKVIDGKEDKIKTIINAAGLADEIYLASDPDREGEAIAWHLADVLKKTKKPIHRVKFHEITKTALNEAIKNLEELDKDLYDAQQARRILDRIVGFSVSPFLMNAFGEKSLSAGRVQSVALRLIVDREREIESFKPEEYWTVECNLTTATDKEEDRFIAKYSGNISGKDHAKKIEKDLNSDKFLIKSIDRKEKDRKPNPPFITSSLAATAAGSLNYKTEQTMKIAQSLYENGFITYMRTDSIRSSDEAISSCRKWLKDNNYDVPKDAQIYSTKNKAAQDAHEAIRPTDVTISPDKISLNPEEKKLYTLIWQRFVASQMKPAVYDVMDVIIESSSGHKLKATGRSLKYKGWLEIHSVSSKDDVDTMLPNLKVGDYSVLIDPGVKAQQKFTQPPSRFSEKTLIKELEKRGIGRPSTYATIMSKITQRQYVNIVEKMFVPSEIGKKIIDLLVQHFKFMDCSYTSNLEELLDLIACGKEKYVNMLGNFYSDFKVELKRAVLSKAQDFGQKCPKCGENMILKHGKFGFYLACINYPQCKSSMQCEVIDGKPVPRKKGTYNTPDENVKCPECDSPMLKKDGKFGQFYACTKYPKCKGKRKVPYGKKCPSCGEELYATTYGGGSVLFCMGYPNCKYSEKLSDDSVANPKELCKDSQIPKTYKKIFKK